MFCVFYMLSVNFWSWLAILYILWFFINGLYFFCYILVMAVLDFPKKPLKLQKFWFRNRPPRLRGKPLKSWRSRRPGSRRKTWRCRKRWRRPAKSRRRRPGAREVTTRWLKMTIDGGPFFFVSKKNDIKCFQCVDFVGQAESSKEETGHGAHEWSCMMGHALPFVHVNDLFHAVFLCVYGQMATAGVIRNQLKKRRMLVVRILRV